MDVRDRNNGVWKRKLFREVMDHRKLSYGVTANALELPILDS